VRVLYFRHDLSVVDNDIIDCLGSLGVSTEVYDVPACNGFLLTDIRDELYCIFDRDEIATYDYNSDLASVVKYYLSRPGLRQDMAKKTRQKVIDGHTYVHRAKTILDAVMARVRKSRRSA